MMSDLSTSEASRSSTSSASTASGASVPPSGQVAHDRLSLLQRPAAREDGEPAQQLPLRAGEQIPAPVHQGAQASAGGGSAARLPPVSRRKRSSRRAAISVTPRARVRAAASSMASGMPSSRRQISAMTGAFSARQREAGLRRPARARRRAARPPIGAAASRSATSGGGQAQRRDAVGRLTGNAQRLAAGGQDGQPGRVAQQRVGLTGAGVNQMLAVVQDHQQLLVAQIVGQRSIERTARLLRHAQRAADGRDQQRRVGYRGQLDQPGAVRVALEPVGGKLQRKSRLARPSRPGQGQESGASQGDRSLHAVPAHAR